MRQYYAVIDTSVIVSSFLCRDSIPGKVIDYIQNNTIIPLFNKEILEEYRDVLARNKFRLRQEDVTRFLSEFKQKGKELSRVATSEPFTDKSDVVFFEIVLSGRSTMDAYLVTGNLRHYPFRSYVVTPRQMLEIIEKEKDVPPLW